MIVRIAALVLRAAAGVLAVIADEIEPPADVYVDEDLDRWQDEPESEQIVLGETDLPWPDRRPSCVNYPYEEYYAP